MPDGAQKYETDGVHIDNGESFSSFAARICQSTYQNSPFVRVSDLSGGHFRGPRGWTLNSEKFPLLRESILTIAADGIGTKPVLIDAVRGYGHAARDLLAMTAGDITRWGGLPLVFSNILDVHELGEQGSASHCAARELLEGLVLAARDEGIVVLTGETAELGLCVFSENSGATFKFNWGGFMEGVYRTDMLISGDTLREGQLVIALMEKGFRSNGMSSVRKALAMRFGEEWWANPEARHCMKACATPSVLYDRFFVDANGWTGNKRIPIHRIVHLTGGSFKSKFGEDALFPRGLSADLYDLFDAPAIMRSCAQWRGMTDEEAYAVWNGGQGALAVLDEQDVDSFLTRAARYRIRAKVCGRIMKHATPMLRIISKFNKGQMAIYS